MLSSLLTLPLAHAKTIKQAVTGALRPSLLNKASVGIVVASGRTDHVLYQRNMNRLFTPASVQKLFTAAAALTYLKPNYHFETGFYTKGTVRHHELQGNLYIKFSGDPSFKLADLDRMMDELKSMNVQRINGRVYIDNFDYNKTPYPPGWIWDDLSYSYAAPLNAIIIDRNKFALRFTPSKIKAHVPTLSSSLPKGVAQFTNNLREMEQYDEHCPITIYSNMHNQYRVGGCLDSRWGPQSRSLAVRNMRLYAETEIKNLLNERDISYKGHVTLRRLPKGSTALVLHASKPLHVLLRHMLKKSDNLYTNAIFKKLGQVYYTRPGTWQNGLTALQHILTVPTGINFSKNKLTDGAGLSRYNLITPRQLTKLLYFVYHDTHIKAPLLAALPIAGKDGTLAGRMSNEGASERVHAKTGSMTGVSALTGYVITRHHGTLMFAIMVNNFVGGRAPYIRLEDRICEALAKV